MTMLLAPLILPPLNIFRHIWNLTIKDYDHEFGDIDKEKY